MARTFGAATSDRVSASATTTMFGNSTVSIIAGWYFPTALNNPRRYWGVGATTNLAIGATTSEVVLTTARATTSAVYTSSGMGMTLNTWQFVCVVVSTSAAGASLSTGVRFYRGTVDGGLVEVPSVVTTAGAGNVTANATIGVGNAGLTQNQSFQGDVDNFVYISTTAAVGASHPFGASLLSAFSDSEAERIRNLYIGPLFQGKPFRDFQVGIHQMWFTLDTANVCYQRQEAGSAGPIAFPTVTNSGTTLATRRSPVPSNLPLRSCAGQRCRR